MTRGAGGLAPGRGRGGGATTWRRLWWRPGFVAGAALLVLVALAGGIGPLLTPDPDATDYAAQLVAPSAEHLLGTDAAGRDVLARTLTATGTSLADALLVSVLTAALGLLVGGVAGYLRGRVDAVLSRVVDVMLGLPDLVIALAVVGAIGVGHLNLLLALVVTQWAYLARVTRGVVLGSHHRLDVVSARLAGVRGSRILLGHVLPGALAQVLVISATAFGSVVLSLAGLSFLGLGAQPPTAELGQMLQDSRGDLAVAPWLAVGPTVVIAATVGAAMLISEALRDALSAGPTRAAVTQPKDAPEGEPVPAVGAEDLVLDVRGLSVAYADGTEAVRGVDLRLAPGECLALIGESGCGKSSLVQALLDVLPPGTRVRGRRTIGRRGTGVGYVAQDPYASFDPLRSVGDHVREAWRVHGRPVPADVPVRLERLGVPDAERRLRERPSRWSGGMLQRASVAAAVAHDPPLLIADEPTSALDAHLAGAVLDVLRDGGRAVLLVSHDLRLVERHCDRVAVMHDGVVVETGPVRDVVDRPQHPYTRQFLAAAPGPVGS